ncbi:DUF5060 domain-containing protein [Winogradskyella litoriviva]|uniref:DUF5060 domain-containing protein n=1 Tax=Winogradskyella litoriviva TaxID=1220182 RepID=A0ABX2E0J8_9FLAO|nr:DUF5060 domain-containing protein [Winogradskyella litoriviva]NRD21820.1 DUF5060 domain-containing protein [Winogradskyella litoriviva]
MRVCLVLLFLFSSFNAFTQEQIEQWNRFEISLKHKTKGNPFQDVKLSAKFFNADTTFVVNGFYDGKNVFKIRFMPQQIGKWNYIISSSVEEFNSKTGSFQCVKASADNHGMVKVSETYHFKYADGNNYYPFGTTAYAWTHMKEELQEETLKTLEKADFNKVRMCVFPKNYDLVKEEPKVYPFKVKKLVTNAKGDKIFIWNFDEFDPEFFQHLEKRIDDLNKIGVQADLILFHPYDGGRWGFDSMPHNVNEKYLEYITARLSSFKNVWWSLANEWNYVDAKTIADWDALTETVVNNDPYRHLCSIHGATSSYYNYLKPEYTHVSIQDEAPVLNSYSSATLRNIYKKPIVLDEVGYEGNLKRRWGRLSPEKMTHLVWNGVIAGAYVTHGEVYRFNIETDTFFWADGGVLKGESWKRIKFLKSIIENAPGPLHMADISRDLITASSGKGFYLMYFGEEIIESWAFNLPKKNAELDKLKEGVKFKVEIIDTWDMTITPVSGVFETKKVNDNYRLYDADLKEVRLPHKPYIALRITEIK